MINLKKSKFCVTDLDIELNKDVNITQIECNGEYIDKGKRSESFVKYLFFTRLLGS